MNQAVVNELFNRLDAVDRIIERLRAEPTREAIKALEVAYTIRKEVCDSMLELAFADKAASEA